jgi:hypothetical protein
MNLALLQPVVSSTQLNMLLDPYALHPPCRKLTVMQTTAATLKLQQLNNQRVMCGKLAEGCSFLKKIQS